MCEVVKMMFFFFGVGVDDTRARGLARPTPRSAIPTFPATPSRPPPNTHTKNTTAATACTRPARAPRRSRSARSTPATTLTPKPAPPRFARSAHGRAAASPLHRCWHALTAPTAALIALSSLPFALQFYKYTAPADGIVIPWACSSSFDATLSVDDGSGDQNCIGPFNGCNDPQISNPDSQTT